MPAATPSGSHSTSRTSVGSPPSMSFVRMRRSVSDMAFHQSRTTCSAAMVTIARHTINSRRTACNKFFEILDEDQKTVEYVNESLDIIKTRFKNRYPEVLGSTADVYAQRVQLVLKDFLAWRADRSAWERDLAARQSTRSASVDGGEGRAAPKTKARRATAEAEPNDDPAARVVKIPLPSGFEVEVTIPRNMKLADLKRILWGLLPYATDWDPSSSPR